MKPTPAKPRIIIAHVEGFGNGTAYVNAAPNNSAGIEKPNFFIERP
jgi:hypothetical protein